MCLCERDFCMSLPVVSIFILGHLFRLLCILRAPFYLLSLSFTRFPSLHSSPPSLRRLCWYIPRTQASSSPKPTTEAPRAADSQTPRATPRAMPTRAGGAQAPRDEEVRPFCIICVCVCACACACQSVCQSGCLFGRNFCLSLVSISTLGHLFRLL